MAAFAEHIGFSVGEAVQYRVGYGFLEQWRDAVVHKVNKGFLTIIEYDLMFSDPSTGRQLIRTFKPSEVRVRDPVFVPHVDEPLREQPPRRRDPEPDHVGVRRHVTATLHDQVGGTCYAHAVARVVTRFLVIHALAGDRTSESIYNEVVTKLVERYGSEGAITRDVLKWVTEGGAGILPADFLGYVVVERIEPKESTLERIRAILRTGSTLVATYALDQGGDHGDAVNQWSHFSASDKDILLRQIPRVDKWVSPGGHAVVLYDILEDERDPVRGLQEWDGPRFRFKNSWGTNNAHSEFTATIHGLCPDSTSLEILTLYHLKFVDSERRLPLPNPLLMPKSPYVPGAAPQPRPAAGARPRGVHFHGDDWRYRLVFPNHDVAVRWQELYVLAIEVYMRFGNAEQLREIERRRIMMLNPSFPAFLLAVRWFSACF